VGGLRRRDAEAAGDGCNTGNRTVSPPHCQEARCHAVPGIRRRLARRLP
jgi:hypothetical protein